MNAPRTSVLVEFYRGVGTDGCGRTLEEILAFDDARLERTHDFIQWLFPLAVPSRFNPDAPILSEDDMRLWRSDDLLRANFVRALRVMLAFYGWQLSDDGPAVALRCAPDGGERAARWLRPGNHNLLRISRILRSCVLCGFHAHAEALLAALEPLCRAHPAVAADSLPHWRAALASRPRP